jgi:lipopolysaccharide/colanic/teichoic acid biosynthesis glycosyltransferase
MELLDIPIKKTKEKIYRHYTVNLVTPSPVVEIIEADKSEFLYIGVNPIVIDSLVSLFDSGYAADSAAKAIIIIKKIIEVGNKKPSLIMVDGAMGSSSMKELNKYLSTSEPLQAIPFFVESSNINKAEAEDMGKLPFVDELVSLEEFNGKLFSKIKLIKKIKDNNLQAGWVQKIDHAIVRKKYSFAFAKRFFDIAISVACLLFLSPLFLLITIAIKLESKGPVFYIAKRAGRGYRIFNFYKFRTMQIGADKKVAELSIHNQYNGQNDEGATGPVFFKINNDPRVTKVGTFLRNTSLDELPQLINVLLGDMSLVGNRPLPLYEAQTLTTDECAARFMAPAGITGLWQIKKRGQDEMSVEERISLDIAYANRNNFIYDLWIMANTPPALMQKSNS